MNPSMRHLSLGLLAIVACGLLNATAAGSAVIPAGLHQGDHYQLMFVTSILTNITTDTSVPPSVPSWGGVTAGDYLVNESAAAAGLMPTWNGSPLYFKAVLSTPTQDARNHILVQAPIYNTNGALVASNATDLWDGTLAAPIQYDEQGTQISTGVKVWTGTTSSGQSSGLTAGTNWNDPTTFATVGYLFATDGLWVQGSPAYGGESCRLYAISPLLVVPAVLPGDANFDSIVNGQDIALTASDWLAAGSSVAGDVNADWLVNGQDIALISSNWLHTAGGAAGNAAAVPEPSAFLLAALGGLALLTWWGRRR
jgi:hypothetical protein